MTDDATPAKVRLTDGLGPWAPAPARTEWGAGMVEALVPLGNDHTLRLYVEAGAIMPALGAMQVGNEAP